MEVLKKLADKQYTISGAADWDMLLAIGGLLMLAIAAMWADLRSKLTEQRNMATSDIHEFKATNKGEHDTIWEAMRACQDDCCPRRKDRRDHDRAS